MSMRLLLSLIFLVGGLTACVRQGSTQGEAGKTPVEQTDAPPHSQLVGEDEGGVDGGGGDTLAKALASEAEVEAAVKEVGPYVERVLNFQEYLYEVTETQFKTNPATEKRFDNEHEGYIHDTYSSRLQAVDIPLMMEVDLRKLRSVQQKMFKPEAGGKRVFDLLARIKFVSKKDGACLDKYHQEKDGSSVDGAETEICLSRSRLTEKLLRPEVMRSVLALATHEIAHRSGATEEEAVALQKAVQAMIPETTFEDLFFDLRATGPALTWGPYVYQSMGYLDENPLDELKFCGSLITITEKFEEHEYFPAGALPKPAVALKYWDAAMRQWQAVVKFCDASPDYSSLRKYPEGQIIDWMKNDKYDPVKGGPFSSDGPYSFNQLTLGIEHSKFMTGGYRYQPAVKYNFKEMYENLVLYEDSNATSSFEVSY